VVLYLCSVILPTLIWSSSASLVLLDALSYWDWTILKILRESEKSDVIAVTILMTFDGAVTGVIFSTGVVGTADGGAGIILS
jgi:hypothetical protein